MQIICVPIIVAIVYAIIELYKIIIKNKDEKYTKVIPIIAGITGAILGVALYFIAPEIIIASDWWVALIVGASSGLSAVGSNQIFKQLKKVGVEIKEADQKEVDDALDKIQSELESFGATSDEIEKAIEVLKGNKNK